MIPSCPFSFVLPEANANFKHRYTGIIQMKNKEMLRNLGLCRRSPWLVLTLHTSRGKTASWKTKPPVLNQCESRANGWAPASTVTSFQTVSFSSGYISIFTIKARIFRFLVVRYWSVYLTFNYDCSYLWSPRTSFCFFVFSWHYGPTYCRCSPPPPPPFHNLCESSDAPSETSCSSLIKPQRVSVARRRAIRHTHKSAPAGRSQLFFSDASALLLTLRRRLTDESSCQAQETLLVISFRHCVSSLRLLLSKDETFFFFLWHAVIMHGIYCVCSTVQVRAAILTCARNQSIIGWIQRPCVITTSIWDNEVLLFYDICRSSCSRGGRWFEDDVEHCVGVRSGDHLSNSFNFCSSTTQNQALLSAPGRFTLSFPLRC